MRRLLIIIIGMAMSLPGLSSSRDSAFVVEALNAARSLPRSTCFPLHFARLFLGRPYVAFTLEVNDEERLVLNTRQLDCTTLVENVTALTLCVYRNLYTWRDFQNALVEMRYRRGRIEGYTSRLHYFSDWIEDNTRKELVEEVQQPNPPFKALQTLNVNYMSRHPQSYKALKAHPEMVPQIAAQEDSLTGRQYRYIPKSEVVNSKVLRSAVRDGDIIAITCNKPGLDIAHLGFAVWREDGLHLLNASQLHKKVVEEPMTLSQYLQKHPSHTGIRVIRIQK
ncbi:MAG: DUF1460 domain-containing protein [Prevotella sp.]|nr:DUF1460 domain-containing protein [Prevotella sp.]